MRITLTIFVVLLMAWAPDVAAQCQCPDKPSLDDAHTQSSMVFIGRVSAIKRSPIRTGKLEVRISGYNFFKREHPESVAEEVVVYTPELADKCGFQFSIEQDYLVFASGTPAHYKVDNCGRTGLVDLMREDVQELARKRSRDERQKR